MSRHMLSRYVLRNLDDVQLQQAISSLTAKEFDTKADLVAHLGEACTRRFFLAAGYPSLHAWCVGHLHFSDDAADKRIRVGRLARDYPVLCEMLADGRLSMSTILLLAPRLKPECAEDLIAAAAGKSRSQVEYLLAYRFPRSDTFEFVSSTDAVEQSHAVTTPKPAPGRVPEWSSHTAQLAPQPTTPSRATTRPLSADRVEWRLTVSRATQEKLEHAQELLGRRVRGGDIAELLDRALHTLIVTEEKRRYAMHRKPRTPRGTRSKNPRHIPADVRRQLAERDGRRCAFVSPEGKRCECRHALEIDHIVPIARGGETTLENLRLLCPAHNQFAAEQQFGAAFMATKRGKRAVAHREPKPEIKFPHEDDVRAALTMLKFKPAEISIGVCEAARLGPEADAEARVKAALAALRPPHAKKQSPTPAGAG
jgi:5-methylcytosine-specific restriction endonuclease McrA